MDPFLTGSGLGSMFGSMFGSNPYKSAMGQLSNVPGMFQNSFGPYMSEGKNLLPLLSQQFMGLMNNPSAVLQRLGQGYQQSPGYQFQLNQGIDAANRGAAANGMYGTPANQVSLEKLGQNLANQDFNQYLGNSMNLYGRGLSGLGGLENQGYDAASTYAGGMGNYFNTLAQLSGESAQYNNQQDSGLGSLLGGVLFGF